MKCSTRQPRCLFACTALSISLVLLLAGSIHAAEPLYIRIDQIVDRDSGPVRAAVAGDAEFLRRVSLDLIGLPPTPEELRAFLADPAADKRVSVVDRLLASPQFVRHMTATLDVMLMERRANQHVPADDWHNYLLKAVRENRSYNVLAREILSADGADPNLRPAVRFYLDRGAEPNLLTRDVGRIFFGRDMQCAQCHDHPLIDDYHQADYQGLYAFFAAGSAFTAPAPDGKAYYAERAGTDIAFESVFLKGVKHVTASRVPGGPELAEPAFYPGDEYDVKPAENVRPVPKFSRRAKLAELATNGTSRAFNENMANRLWAHMLGRGLVHPVDLHHSANPPSHPELLRMLAEEFAATGFNMRAFLREVALTRAYQRSIDIPSDLIEQSPQAAALAAELDERKKQLAATAAQAEEVYKQAAAELKTAREAAAPILTELEQASAPSAEIVKKLDAAQKAVTDAQAQVSAKQGIATTVAEAAAKTDEAAKKLPQDQELLQAAQKFAERSTQLTAEIVALTTVVAEKQALVPPIEAEVATSRQPIDAVRAKLAPLAEAVRQKDETLGAARQQVLDQQTQLTRLDARIASAQRLAGLLPLRDMAVASAAAVGSAESSLEVARQAVVAMAAVVSEKETVQKTAQSEHTATIEALTAVKAEHARRQQTSETVASAAAQAEAARQQLPDDAVLVEAAQKLKTKGEELAAALAEHQKQMDAATTAETTATAKLTAAAQAFQTATAEMSQKQQQVAAAEQAVQSAVAKSQSDKGALEQAQTELANDAAGMFAAGSLKPLTPEQICWTLLRVTGFYERQAQAEAAELNTASPLSEDALKDPAQVAARQAEIEQRVYDKLLKANVPPFVTFYGSAAGAPQSDFFATADQALFAANGATINSWIAPAAGNLAERMINQADPKLAADDLYLTVLSRPATEQETAEVGTYLASRPEEKAACVQELIWALITSAEFRFNH